MGHLRTGSARYIEEFAGKASKLRERRTKEGATTMPTESTSPGNGLGPMGRVLCVCTAWALLASPAWAEVRFANIFGDNMVLQQGKSVRVWGWAEPGAEVKVTLTEDAALAAPFLEEEPPRKAEADAEYKVTIAYVEENAEPFEPQSAVAKADGDGAWLVELAPMAASFSPKCLVAQSGDEGAAVTNVLVGEVWICSGQSNMDWKGHDARDLEWPSACYSGIRYCDPDGSWYKPLEDIPNPAKWRVCSPETADSIAAVPYYFALYVHRYLKVPVGVINNARGGTLGQTWTSREALDGIEAKVVQEILRQYDAETTKWESEEYRRETLAAWEEEVAAKRAEWEEKAEQAKAEGKEPPRLRLPKKPGDPRSGWSPPAGMFNAVVWPLRKMAIRGALYYQGENNQFRRWTQYEYTFPTIIPAWRKAFGEDDLPFGIITLPGWGRYGEAPEVSVVADGYAIVRDIHTRTHQATPNTGLITTYDVGNSYIHPGWKQPVGERAARWALAKVYEKPVLHTGPTLREMKKADGKLLLYFTPDPINDKGPEGNKELPIWQAAPVTREGNADFRGFIIAGEDQRWYPARAQVNKKERALEVWSDLVPDPVAVRYGWAQWPTGNACGNRGLPVPTFRTDDWPIVTVEGYNEEVRKASAERIEELRKIGNMRALDRQIREASLSLAQLERELYMGRYMRDPKRLLTSKAERIEAALAEFRADDVRRQYGEAVEGKLGELERILEELKSAIQALPE